MSESVSEKRNVLGGGRWLGTQPAVESHLQKRAVPQPRAQNQGGLAVQPSQRALDVHTVHIHAAVLG